MSKLMGLILIVLGFVFISNGVDKKDDTAVIVGGCMSFFGCVQVWSAEKR